MAAGKTTALFYTGGTEQRGPQNVNGGHTLMAESHGQSDRPATRATPSPCRCSPYTPNNASADAARNDRAYARDSRRGPRAVGGSRPINTGFKNVILMRRSRRRQRTSTAKSRKKLDAKYAPQGIHVYFCDEVYAKAQGDFDKWLAANGYPGQLARRHSRHVGDALPRRRSWWTRTALIPTAVGDTTPRGATRDPNAPRVNNGIIRRRAAFVAGARQRRVRPEGRLRGEYRSADSSG